MERAKQYEQKAHELMIVGSDEVAVAQRLKWKMHGLFDAADADGSGGLDAAELKKFAGEHPGMRGFSMDELDVDHDGRVS